MKPRGRGRDGPLPAELSSPIVNYERSVSSCLALMKYVEDHLTQRLAHHIDQPLGLQNETVSLGVERMALGGRRLHRAAALRGRAWHGHVRWPAPA
jgi:hypothetical protein